ncbi:MAG: hypothetical protein HC897_20390, partial [Thermoanaerobaculia bacterium]|nr:hypothetical protein [Thermoanaerobaculia bacterium]
MRVWPRWFLPWALLALPAAAQQYPSQARGLGAAVAYQSGDLDHVNLFNGQLSLTLPLGQGYPVGPGLGYGPALTYTSNRWSFNNFRTCSSPGGTTSLLDFPNRDCLSRVFCATSYAGRAGPLGAPSSSSASREKKSRAGARAPRPDTAAGSRFLVGLTCSLASYFLPEKTVGVDFPRAPGDSFIPCHHRTTVTDPLGNDTVSYFTSSYALHRGSYGLPFTGVSKRLTSLKVPSITTYAFETDFNWHPLGVLSDIDYPECLHPRCSGRAPPRNVAYSYTRGFQTAVPGYASSITYQGGGMLHQVQHTNGVSYTLERETASALDRPYRISTNRGWDTGIYAYDGAGNVKQIGTQDFRYDRFKRMSSGEVSVSGQDRVQSANYDVYNNLLSLTTNGSALTTSVNASTNRLTSVSALYDAAGNLTRQVRGSETHQYTYDPLGMLKYLQSTTDQAQVYLYDADDERLATYDCFPGVCDSPGWELRTTVRGLGGEPLREYSTRGTNGWQWVRDYVYRAGGLLAAVEPNGSGGETVYHLHTDHLGTPRQITNANGVQVALHSYYPFGQEATDPAQTAFTKKFTGHERDPNGTGTAGDLDYMHARYCSPTLGRFLSFDPIGGNPRAPQSWNRYAYALNSPMNYTDPEG